MTPTEVRPEVRLKVMEALQEEAYKGIVRIDSETMHAIGVRQGGVAEIEGEKKTVGIVDRAYPTDVGQAIIRMDGILRRNARTGIGEMVKVRRADVKEAKSVTIAPAQKGVTIQADPVVFKRGLLGRAVVKGDQVALGGARSRRRTMEGSPFEEIFEAFEQGFMGPFGLGGLKFIVVDVNPKQAVIVTENTSIHLNPKAVEMPEEKVIDVTYEDIGGLDEELTKVRELVETPLRHPELFQKLGIEPPAGILLYGPPGSGKTLLAKAVANESEANFILLNGPEVMNKFYGECVDENSLVFSNGPGLVTIKEAMADSAKHIAGLEMDRQRVKILPVTDKFDKGVKSTLTVTTPHSSLTLTPTSLLLKLSKEGDLEWSYVKDLNVGDKVAIAKKLPLRESIPPLLYFLEDNTYLVGSSLREFLDSIDLKNNQVAKILGVPQRKYEDWKYRKTMPAWCVKKLYTYAKKKDVGFKLLGKGRVPSLLNDKLMYVLGLLSGDGHLRYTPKGGHVTTVHFTNNDKAVVAKYKGYLKDLFHIDNIKYDGKYGYYFSSSPIGTLLHNLGIPKNDKSHTLSVPSYLVFLPDDLIAAYLSGLYDTDGYVHLPKSGKQISYYSMSEKMARGLMMLLLRFEIQSTMRQKSDGTFEVTINNTDSIKIFGDKIKLNHLTRSERLARSVGVKYNKPVHDRVPVVGYVKQIAKSKNISGRELLRNGINPSIGGYSRDQLKQISKLFSKHGVPESDINKLNTLAENDIVWSPIRKIEGSIAHVYDLTVPKDHNFIANGFIVHNSEKRLRDLFEEAEKNAPSIVFIDEIDAIAPKREEVHGEVERRVVSQLLTSMDGLKARSRVVVIGATNRPNALDPALRRPGRFDREIQIGVPDKSARLEILKIHTRNMPLTKDVKLEEFAEVTHGFVGADLSALAKEAAMNVLRKVLQTVHLREKEPIPQAVLDKIVIEAKDFKDALKVVRPSAMREVLIETPNISWTDIGGLDELKQELKEAVEWPIKTPESFKRLGIRPPRGILLYGPPGTGKTLLAKAVAKESEANFIFVKGPSLLNMWVGETEKGVRQVFERARQTAPTIIFFDEIDAIAPRRGFEVGTKVTERIVNTLLAEMDGLEEMHDVVVIGATNRPDILDPALLRPGRFDRLLLTSPPDEKSRLEIFKIHTGKMPILVDKDEIKIIENELKGVDDDSRYEKHKIISKMASDESIKASDLKKLKEKKKISFKDLSDRDKLLYYLSEKTEGYSGSDIEAVCREAGMLALREDIKAKEVKKKFFEKAMDKVRPSIPKDTMDKYKAVEEEYLRSAKSALQRDKQSYFG